MRFWRINIKVIFALLLPLASPAQSAHGLLRKGDDLYDRAKYSEAKKPYYDALKKSKPEDKANYNLGNTYYREGDYSNAAKLLNNSAQSAKTPDERADAYHNLGNAFLKQEKYPEAIDAYQKSLMNRPGDPETKQNLQMAKQRLQQQEKEQKQQQQNNQQQQGQEQSPPQEQDPSNNPQQKPPEQKEPPKEPKQKEQQPQQTTKLEQPSEQFLEAIGREDRRNKRKYQEKTNNVKPGTKRKDWK